WNPPKLMATRSLVACPLFEQPELPDGESAQYQDEDDRARAGAADLEELEHILVDSVEEIGGRPAGPPNRQELDGDEDIRECLQDGGQTNEDEGRCHQREDYVFQHRPTLCAIDARSFKLLLRRTGNPGERYDVVEPQELPGRDQT